MKKYWLFREEFYRSFHRWPIIIAFITLGCLIGWLCSLIWPSYYRSTVEVYVGFNPYREYSDTNFLALSKPRYANLDNYLYWQMYQLEGAIFLPEIIQDTLERLRLSDQYWNNISASQLTSMLDAEWRTAGQWNLTAESRDPDRGLQAVQTWSKTSVDQIKESVQSARNIIMIDDKLQSTTTKLREIEIRLQDLQLTRSSLLEWRAKFQDLPSSQTLDKTDRWRTVYLGTRIVTFTPPWQQIIKNEPAADAPPDAYIEWIDQIIPLIDAEIPILEPQITELDKESSRLQEEYSKEADESLGLSPNLEMKEIKEIPTKNIRPTSSLILIGGTIGLLIWLLWQLITLTNRVKDQ
jgi:hypothetical protein